MITKRTKVQLLVFVFITLLGVSYVGARYAQLDRYFFDESYRVVAHFEESGGIFEGAGVTYRGVTVGQVADMKVTERGVDVVLSLRNDTEPIPADTDALVANLSAVGEQYVDLQPASSSGPYLEDGSQIPVGRTDTPISATQLLVNLDQLVNSVNRDSLRTVVSELGRAFNGTGRDLAQIIDTSNSFIATANDNFDVTTALIEESNTVLRTQLDSASSIRSFARDLALVSDTLVRSDQDLRTVIENGDATANQLRTFLEQNRVDLGALINNLVTTGEITVARLDGVEQILVIYPYVVAGGYTVVAEDPQSGLYDAHFGMVLTQAPAVCQEGYDAPVRDPQNRKELPMDMDARCTEPQAQSNARGAQHAPRAGTAYRAPVVAAYDPVSQRVSFTDESRSEQVSYTGGAEAVFGDDSWKWLLLQPLSERR